MRIRKIFMNDKENLQFVVSARRISNTTVIVNQGCESLNIGLDTTIIESDEVAINRFMSCVESKVDLYQREDGSFYICYSD